MKRQYFKIIIIAVIAALLLIGLFIKVSAQDETEHLKILTEISTDIKYIKNDIQEIKMNNKEVKEGLVTVGTRVTKVEERQIVIKEDISEVSGRNNWVTGFIGSILILMLGLQLKRSYSHRKNNGSAVNKNN